MGSEPSSPWNLHAPQHALHLALDLASAKAEYYFMLARKQSRRSCVVQIVYGPMQHCTSSYWNTAGIAPEMACLLGDAQHGPSSTQMQLLTDLSAKQRDAAGKPIRVKYDSFLLSGPPGCGKTMACLAAAVQKQHHSAGSTAVVICSCEQEAQQVLPPVEHLSSILDRKKHVLAGRT